MHYVETFLAGAVCGGGAMGFALFSAKLKAEFQALHAKADAILAAVRAK